MKRNILFLFAGMLLTCVLGFTATISYETKNATAEADYVKGVHIFIRSTPVKEYEYLGSLKNMGMQWTGKPKEMVNKALNKAKSNTPKPTVLSFIPNS